LNLIRIMPVEGSGKVARPLLRPFFCLNSIWGADIAMDLTVNGKTMKISGATIRDLLVELQIDPARVAVERNLEIVPKKMYESLRVCDGDRIEIVHFVGGG
jgi:thiamine biosynthesis protein ThiS